MPAKKMALTDKVPAADETIADRVKDVLTRQKIEKLAPAYLDKLKTAADVQILDADLKAAVAALPAAPPAAAGATSTNAPAHLLP
jgi:hypothetical protein